MCRDTKREISCSRKNPAFSRLSIREANRKREREKTKTATTTTTKTTSKNFLSDVSIAGEPQTYFRSSLLFLQFFLVGETRN